ncbi:hypothetical protein PZA11_002630 [Diplocarpon coronariae]|uniref:Uncharacterized protein n=1 Tax=Diplocarpon coronariae TaxID=2795749 RepID=A0A218YVD3_9HELO|nr:hypothetical protein B2J93_6801 [Marssonina coronariae]
MAPSIYSIVARSSSAILRRDDDDDDDYSMSGTMIDLLIALMVLVLVALGLAGALLAVRKVRRSRAIARQQLPTYNEPTNSARPVSNHRRLTVTAAPYGRASSIYVYGDEKSAMMSPTTPTSPVPEIRITFPDEHDEAGRRKSGGVVIVRVGENGVGLEPVQDEQLPAYEKEGGERFHSIDMESIGGLRENHAKDQYS